MKAESAQDCSASIYQVFAKPRCKPIWISQSHLTGLGHVPVVAGSFTGLQQRERAHSITFIPQLRSQVGRVLRLPELWQLTTERATDFLKCTAALRWWSWLQISGNRGRKLAKERDYNRHLPLWLNVPTMQEVAGSQFNTITIGRCSFIRSEKIWATILPLHS